MFQKNVHVYWDICTRILIEALFAICNNPKVDLDRTEWINRMDK